MLLVHKNDEPHSLQVKTICVYMNVHKLYVTVSRYHFSLLIYLSDTKRLCYNLLLLAARRRNRQDQISLLKLGVEIQLLYEPHIMQLPLAFWVLEFYL